MQYAASQGIAPPPHLRHADPAPEAPKPTATGSDNYLDIPAFLRRQAD